MHLSRSLLWTWLMLAIPAHGAEPVAEMPQLIQLNRSSQQALRGIQSSAPPPGQARQGDRDPESGQLDRRQRTEQGALQENQRRELLLQKQRAKTVNDPAASRRLDAIGRHRQFRMQQHDQLNRFRIQQGTRP